MTDRDKRQGGRPFKPGGKPGTKKFAGGLDKKRPGRKSERPERPDAAPKAQQGERIAKAMARAGACSRREAEEWIAAGRVAVNGRTLESPAFNVTGADRVTIDGKPMAAREKTRLFLFHKPRGLVTTDHDPEGRQTIFDYLADRHPELPRLMSVGRLDINTEGLLLLTNDGGLARTLELPQTGWLRRYRVRAHGETDQAALDALARGVSVDGVDYAGIDAKLDRAQGANTWLTLGLREGKNREVRRVLGSIGLEVNRLIRVSYGPFQLGELAEGAVEEVRTRVLRDQLGPTLIAQSLADFDAPLRDEEDEPRGRERSSRRDGERPARAASRFDRSERAERPSRAPRGEKFDDRGPRRTFGAREEREEAPEKRERPKPGARKHVSALRAERKERLNEGERVRVERGATADRKGRAVVVERVVAATPKQDAPDTRNARRFKAERDTKDVRKKGGRFGGKGQVRDDTAREERRREDGGERPMRRARSEGPRSFEPREEGRREARPPRRDGERFQRDRNEGFSRGARDDARGEKRFERGEGRPSSGKSFGERSFGGERKGAPRGPRPGGAGARSEGARKGPPRGGDGPRKGPPRGKPRGKN